jgi:hypothetical protein
MAFYLLFLPIVYGILCSYLQSVMSHFRALNGAWSFALFDYFNEGLTPYFTEPQCREDGGLFTLEDMYSKSLLTSPNSRPI